MRLRDVVRSLEARLARGPAPANGDHANGDGANPPMDFGEEFGSLLREVGPYTMTSPERVHALWEAVNYVVERPVAGAIVECGVWRGGSMMAVARTLLRRDRRDRHLYLFDTFSGMVPPGELDERFDGVPAGTILDGADDEHRDEAWCVAPLEEVRGVIDSTGYPKDFVHYVGGRVEDTLPDQAPDRISLLRLDTDWYESTRHELEHLFPRLVPGGVLIIDDYGFWKGARRAVDEYLANTGIRLLLHRIDDTGRIAVVPG
jgi:O-methyltransferase